MKTDLYQHCSRCGDELTSTEQKCAADDDSPLPPLCTSCALQVFRGMAQLLPDFVSDILRSVNEVFRPMVEALNDADLTIQTDPGQSDAKTEGDDEG